MSQLAWTRYLGHGSSKRKIVALAGHIVLGHIVQRRRFGRDSRLLVRGAPLVGLLVGRDPVDQATPLTREVQSLELLDYDDIDGA